MRLLNLYAENTLNLRAVSVSFKPGITRITGKNGAGKTAFFSAIFWALAGKKGHAADPIRHGQKKAIVRLDLGSDKVELTVTLTITASDAYLDVEAPNSPPLGSPQKVLNALIGPLMFDPHSFSSMPAKERLEVLRKIVKLDVDLDALDRDYARDYALRTEWNRKKDSSKERLATARAALRPAMDVTPIDISALTQRMADASEHNAAIDQLRSARERMTASIADRREIALRKRVDAQRLIDEAIALENATVEDDITLINAEPLPERTDVSALREQINNAMQDNATRDSERRQREAHKEAEKELQDASRTADGLTEALDAVVVTKKDALAKAKFPIEGLGFGDGDVTFEGIVFDQVSTGKRMRIEVAIGMALNPTLRVIFVRNAALLDRESRETLDQLCEEHDMQALLEMTQDSPTVGIHIVDGEVAAIDGVPVHADEDGALAIAGQGVE